MTIQPEDILNFWFEGDPSVRRTRWFAKDPDFDAACSRFVPDIRAARGAAFAEGVVAEGVVAEGVVAEGVVMECAVTEAAFIGSAYAHWARTPRGMLAAIVLLDQLSRNVFRGTAEAFAADPAALRLAQTLVDRGEDTALAPFERMFVYLPFEHAESMEQQERSVRLFSGVVDALGQDTVDYAHRHRDVIRAYGRFPHRNAALGRLNTAAEEVYLSRPDAGF